MHAVIMAGGKGTRLRPYTTVLPKPMMPIGEFPILEVVIRQLKRSGFTRVTLCVNHQADIIKAYFSAGQRLGVNIDYVLEDRPLGTMGALRLVQDLDEKFLVMNGDVLTDLNFGVFLGKHKTEKYAFTISSAIREEKIDYGVLITENEILVKMNEKPINKYQVSMGVYAVSKEIVQYIPKNQDYGFDKLMNELLIRKKSILVRTHKGYWLDIGRPDDYMKAIDDYENSAKWDFT